MSIFLLYLQSLSLKKCLAYVLTLQSLRKCIGPQQERCQEEKDLLWKQLVSILAGIPEGEELTVAEVLNEHVGRDRQGAER